MADLEIYWEGPGDPVVIADIGGREITQALHETPLFFDVLAEFSGEDIAASADLQAALDAGTISALDANGNAVTNFATSVSEGYGLGGAGGKLFADNVNAADSVNALITYHGAAVQASTDTSLPSWMIYRSTRAGSNANFEYADGNVYTDNIWDDRESLTYITLP